jgi:hypothetical protein
MAGGLLNIISVGKANIILTGNPTKTFFKVAYSKYTNFGLQKFRLDYDGMRELRLTEPSKFTFKVKRYADLLMDTYLVVNLPDIWSPAWSPSENTDNQWSPYDARWIQDIGVQMIDEIEITCGSVLLQRYSGRYINAMVQRDFNAEKRDLFNKMTGNIPELVDPSNWARRNMAPPYTTNTYPTAMYNAASNNGAEPSIRGRTIYIPLNTWFMLESRCAFPLVALQYNELSINVTLRPIQQLIQVRDVFNPTDNFPYVQPDFNQNQFQMYRYLQTPPSLDLSSSQYENQTLTWNADVHLLATYCFLSEDEQQLFAAQDQVYLVKDVFEYSFLNVVGTSRVKLESSHGMVSSWMWYFQRNDAFLRNEWSNYSNWAYKTIPQNLSFNVLSGLYITGNFASQNQYDIMETGAIVLSGEYRENSQPSGVYDYVEKYTRTPGSAKEGLYCYNYCLDTSPFVYQPSGALNMSRFKNVELEFTTFLPPIDDAGNNLEITCDDGGTPIFVNQKPSWALYTYNYNLVLFEERYNILSLVGGNCGMMYAR